MFVVKGLYVFIIVIGVFINILLFIVSLLQVFFVVNIGKCISFFGSIIVIYVCSYIFIKRYKSFWRLLKLIINEYILILVFFGMMVVFMLDLLMVLVSFNFVIMFVFSCVVCMLEIYFQIYFFIKIK